MSAATQVGVFLTNQHPTDADLVAAQREQLSFVAAARDHGWDSVWAGQHYLPEGMSMLQPVPFLGRLMADAGEMRVGLGILLMALQNPVHIAETFASLDVLCEGRFILGVGLGYRDVEYGAFGLTRSEGVHRLEENLRLVRELWKGEPVTADLPWCRLDGAVLGVLPAQRPRPPIWMAANADRAVARAARLADTWIINPHATMSTIERQLELYRSARTEATEPPSRELPLIREVFCATDPSAQRAARDYLTNKYRVYAGWGQDRVMPEPEDFTVPIDDLAADRFIIGSPDECLERLLPWQRRLGVNHFIFRTHWSGMPAAVSLGSMKLLADEVVPVLKEAQ